MSFTRTLSGVGHVPHSCLSGTHQVINLDEMTICRIAPPHTNRTVRQDDAEIDILLNGKCEVGRELVVLVDLRVPSTAWTPRLTTGVLAIKSLEFEPPNT